jgi:hypothetical protein
MISIFAILAERTSGVHPKLYLRPSFGIALADNPVNTGIWRFYGELVTSNFQHIISAFQLLLRDYV